MKILDNLVEYAVTDDCAQWVRPEFVKIFLQTAIFVAHFTWHDAGIRWDLRLQLDGQWLLMRVLQAVFRHVIPTGNYRQAWKFLLRHHLIGKEGVHYFLGIQTHVTRHSKALARDERSHVQNQRVIDSNTPIVHLDPILHNLTPGGIGVRARAGLIKRFGYRLQPHIHLLGRSIFFLLVI